VIALLALAAVALALGAAAIVTYNRFVARRNKVRDAWADVDAELRRRHDLIPNLARVAQGYAAHERQLLDEVARARAVGHAADGADAADVAARRVEPERAVADGLRRLIAVAEAAPTLRADDHFRTLQHELAVTEDRIAVVRRIYNSAVRAYNTGLETFPTNLVGRVGRFHRAAYFDVDEAVRHDVPSAA
jgi:LemA protein